MDFFSLCLKYLFFTKDAVEAFKPGTYDYRVNSAITMLLRCQLIHVIREVERVFNKGVKLKLRDFYAATKSNSNKPF